MCTHTHTHNWMLFCYKKEKILSCMRTNGPWGHYDKWNESDSEWQILYYLVYMWNLKKSKITFIDTVYRLVVARGESWRAGKMDEEGQNVVFQL